MIRLASTLLLLALSLGCGRDRDQPTTVTPSNVAPEVPAVPEDPFGASSPAYERLRQVTDSSLAQSWSGRLEDFATWLEEQTVAIERSLALLKSLRVGPRDIYAVANARVAMSYEHIAVALAEASKLADAQGHAAEWAGQEERIWEQADGFWRRCVRNCGAAGPHLDAWDLRCRSGVERTQAQLVRSRSQWSPRQPE